MRYAIVSDIHANLAAWRTALADIADMRADRIICLGDVVGYGAEPVEVLESVYRKAYAVLMGNHDAAVCGKMGVEVFTPRAAQAVVRHRGLLSATGLRWLSQLPLVLNARGFRCAHGDFSAPAAYNYILDAEEALPSWRTAAEQLLFVGHTHCPCIHVVGKSGTPHVLPPGDFTLEAGKRYIVNPGSIGYPRSREGRSTYCIYDDHARTVVFRSLPFDHEGYVASLRKAGIEVEPWLEQQEAAQNIPELRERLSFAKPLDKGQYAQRVKQEARPRSRRFIWAIVLLALLLMLGVWVKREMKATPYIFHSIGPLDEFVMVPNYELDPIHAYPLSPPDRNLLPALPVNWELGSDKRLPGWRYRAEAGTPFMKTTNRNEVTTLKMSSSGRIQFTLESPLITLTGTQLQAVRMRGRAWRDERFDGVVMCQLVTYEEKTDGTFEQVAVTPFEVRYAKGHGTLSINRKVTFPKRVTHLRFRIEATFNGVLEIEQPVLTAETIRDKK